MVAFLNALWLMPLYAWAVNGQVMDPIVAITVSHVPARSPVLLATVLSAYLLFGYTMYRILQEIKWFTKIRHEFLRRPTPRNYS